MGNAGLAVKPVLIGRLEALPFGFPGECQIFLTRLAFSGKRFLSGDRHRQSEAFQDAGAGAAEGWGERAAFAAAAGLALASALAFSAPRRESTSAASAGWILW